MRMHPKRETRASLPPTVLRLDEDFAPHPRQSLTCLALPNFGNTCFVTAPPKFWKDEEGVANTVMDSPEDGKADNKDVKMIPTRFQVAVLVLNSIDTGGSGDCGWRALAFAIASLNGAGAMSDEDLIDRVATLAKTMQAKVTTLIASNKKLWVERWAPDAHTNESMQGGPIKSVSTSSTRQQ